jgi:hypothetical protein
VTPKSAKSPSAVTPAAPGEIYDADSADPVEVAKQKAEQLKTGKGKYGSTKVPEPPKPEEEKTGDSWVEIQLVDQNDEPVTGKRYEITLPDGRIVAGTTDGKGQGRADGFAPGSCKVSLPDVDKDAWQKA